MPVSQTPSSVHAVDVPLSNVSVAYQQEAEKYVALKACPVISVNKQSDRYYIYSRESLLRDEAKARAPGTRAAETTVSLSTDTYFATKYSLTEKIPDEVVQNADDAINPLRDATENVTQKLLTRIERIWAANFFVSGAFDLTYAGTGSAATGTDFLQFNASNSNPLTTIQNAMWAVQSTTGFLPNKAFLSPNVWFTLKNHSTIVGISDRGTRGSVTKEELANMLELKSVDVCWSVYNSAAEGATENTANIFSDGLLLMYVPDRPGIRQPSAGYSFSWNFGPGAGGNGNPFTQVKQWREEGFASQFVEGSFALDFKKVSTSLGIFLTDCLA